MKIPLMNPICTEEMQTSAIKALRNERFLKGDSVVEFENDFARFIGVKYAAAVNNGTSALHLSLLAMGIKAGDYVLTTPATFIATANVILYVNAKPIFTDILTDTYTIDPEKIKLCIKKYKTKVKAIIPVHLYGHPCTMDEITEICHENDILLLEDACQAHGAKYKGKRIGSLGNAAAFSFYPSKNMTVCGDGGMLTTNDESLYEKVRSLRDVGRATNEPYLHNVVGYSARMNTVNAAIGKVQLKYLEVWNAKRCALAKLYSEKLEGVGDLVLPLLFNKDNGIEQPVFHLYVVRTKYRNALKQYLSAAGIECGIHYPIPLHLQPPYKKFGFAKGMYPIAERWAKEVLSLPLFPDLTEEQISYVIAKVKEFYTKRA